MTKLLADFTWRQSNLAAYLRCPRAFELEHVLGLPAHHPGDGYAAIQGDAVHLTIAKMLTGQLAPQAIQGGLHDAFMAALERAQEQGVTTDPERLGAAIARLDEEQLPLLQALAEDPRIHAVEWKVEEAWASTDSHGRKFSGTVDGYGVVRHAVRGFGQDGDQPVDVFPGDVVMADWKTGVEVATDFPSRSLNLQLPLYAAHLLDPGQLQRAKLFLAPLRDLARPVRPRGTDGEVIPSKLSEINPAWLEAAGLVGASEQAIDQCRKRPKGPDGAPIPKRLERENPAYVAACSRPKGPLFHLVRPDWPVVSRTIGDAIDGARAGLFPASGALNGACRSCSFRARCAHSTHQPTEDR